MPTSGRSSTAGGRNATGIDAVAWAEEAARRGAGEILLTSMDRDGTKAGFDLALTRAARARCRFPLLRAAAWARSSILPRA